ncbi:MAG: aquaporin [Thermoleophilia bacterium]|nr:aquaporin [Thermoleophilia bacterium]
MRRGVAEALGAGALTFFGAGSIITLAGIGEASLLTVAAAHGLVLGIMVTALGHVSGGHFNPAVTFGFLITKRITRAMATVYFVSQLAGAVVAALLLRAVFDDELGRIARFGTPELADGVSAGEGFLLEVLMTFALVLVVFATAVDKRGAFPIVAGFAIGLAVSVGILVGGPLTGAAMNPARAFGPQLVGWIWSDGWLYYLAPLFGGALAALLYDRLYLKEQPPEPF